MMCFLSELVRTTVLRPELHEHAEGSREPYFAFPFHAEQEGTLWHL